MIKSIAPQQVIVGLKILRLFAHGPGLFGLGDIDGQRGDNRLHDVTLKCENILIGPLIAIGPDMSSVRSID